MRHSKVFKRQDGSRVRIDISVYLDGISSKIEYLVSASQCPPNKRTFSNFVDKEHHEFRKLSMAERRAYALKIVQENCSKEEISETFNELMELMKPTEFNTTGSL